MEQSNELLLETLLAENKRRRALLPTWIKVFAWIFMIMGALVPIVFIIGLLGGNAQLSLYGLETNNPLSPLGIFLVFLFMLKGFAAFSLWMEKDLAINLAIADAILGIVVCGAVMFIIPFLAQNLSYKFSFRLELALLIPYLLKLQKIKPSW
jgi:hypothetical protein